MCSAPVHVKLQVSLQHNTYKGESSGLVPDGQTIPINTSSSFSLEDTSAKKIKNSSSHTKKSLNHNQLLLYSNAKALTFIPYRSKLLYIQFKH